MKLSFALRSITLLLAMCPAALASIIWYVDGVNGSDNNNCKSRQHACKTIGHVIALASSGDSIMVAPATYYENLTIGINLKVIGAGAKTTIIDGGANGTVITINNGQINLAKVTIQNGYASSNNGGGIYNTATLVINSSTVSGNSEKSSRGKGGGIYNAGTLTINNGSISGNSTEASFGDGGGISNAYAGTLTINKSTITQNQFSGGTYSAGGGGISNFGTLTINHSTISGNRGSGSVNCFGGGGGTSNSRTLTINDSTLSGNGVGNLDDHQGRAWGGGVYNRGTLTINNGTLSGNTAFSRYLPPLGGGIYGAATLQNSIVANSPSGGNCSGTMTSNGYNLSSDNTCNFNNIGDLNNTDPVLGRLGNYGGRTQTIPLLSGSPAIDAGNPKGCTDGNGHLLKTDQRGKPRPDKEDTGGCDMGAFERQKD